MAHLALDTALSTDVEIGQRIRAWRLERGMSRRVAALLIDRGYEVWRNREYGRASVQLADVRILDRHGLPAGHLLCGDTSLGPLLEDEEIGQELRAARIDRGLTQMDAGFQWGREKQYWFYERGLRWSLLLVRHFAGHGLDPVALLFGSDLTVMQDGVRVARIQRLPTVERRIA